MLKYIALILLAVTATVNANDLDDGIAIDSPINDDINPDKNIKFITRKAMSRAKSGGNNGRGTCGTGNITIGPGSKVKEVINLSTNKGNTAVCGD